MGKKIFTILRLKKFLSQPMIDWDEYIYGWIYAIISCFSMHQRLPGLSSDVENLAWTSDFYQFPRDLATINAWKTMIDPYHEYNH